MIGGKLNLVRALAAHEVWLCEAFSRGQAFVDLLLLANDEPRDVFIKGNQVPLRRGQMAWSQRALAERWRWKRDKVACFLQWLADRDMILVEQSNLTSVITLTNFDLYQSQKPATDNDADLPIINRNPTTAGATDGATEGAAAGPMEGSQKGERGKGKEEERAGGFCPDDLDVLAFAAKFPGEPASGTPGPIPTEYAAAWLARMMGRQMFPARWERALVAQWRADHRTFAVAPAGEPQKKNGAGFMGATASRIALEQEAKKLRAALDRHPVRPDTDSPLNDYSEDRLRMLRAEYKALKTTLADTERQLEGMTV